MFKPGDKIRYKDGSCFLNGDETVTVEKMVGIEVWIKETGRWVSKSLIELANDGPVRTVTRREIVPGVYGPVKIGEISTGVSIGTDAMVFIEKLEISLIGEKFTKSDVDEMIHVLTQIRGAM